MSLVYAIQAKWAATNALTTLIPAARFFTGRAPKAAGGGPQPLPYATISIPDTDVKVTTNAALFRSHTVRFEYWVNSFAEGEAIELALESTVENWSTNLAGGHGHLRELAPGPCQRQQEEDPANGRYWHFIFDFTAYIDRVRRAS